MTRELVLQLASTPRGPVSLRIARSIVQEIERGRLRPGERLPSSRKLAAQLGVHRKTVMAGFRELLRQGFITTERAKGTFVSLELPSPRPAPQRATAPYAAGFLLSPLALPSTGATPRAPLLLFGGVPELSFVPKAALARAWRKALLGRGSSRLLDYGGDPRGEERLRRAVVELLIRNRGVRATPETVNIVRGTHQGLYLAVRALLKPGDGVAIEALNHPSLRGVFQLAGMELLPVPVDGDGLDVEALEKLCASRRVKAVYTTPHHQLPTTVTLSAARRQRLLELAHRHGLIVFEDDYDHEFQYEGAPVLPLAFSDRFGVVVYLGTMSKILAPGLRMAFVASSAEVADRIARYRSFVDLQGDQILEQAVAELIEDGELERHVRRARRAYRSRRDALIEAFKAHLPELEFNPPSGGMAIWARAPGTDMEAWAQRARAAGVAFQTASHFALGAAPRDFARFGFAACDEAQLAEASRRLAKTLRSTKGA